MVSRLRFPVWTGLLALGVVLSVGVALAFNLNGQDWTHVANPMGEDYVVCENTADTVGEGAAIDAAAATWNADAANFDFTSGGNACNPAPVFDEVNQIRWGATAGSLATTTWWYDTNTNDIFECDCVFNDDFSWSTAAATPGGSHDVESVMLHEFGHCLSLGHSVPPAIMQPTIPSGTQRRNLTPDDRNGIRAIYGGGNGNCSVLGVPAAAADQGPAQTLVNFLLLFSPALLVAVAWLFLRARRGRA